MLSYEQVNFRFGSIRDRVEPTACPAMSAEL